MGSSSKLNRQRKNRQVDFDNAMDSRFSPGWGQSSTHRMFPPFGCSPCADGDWQRHHQERKLRMMRFWRDGLERQIAAVTAAISTLEQQIERDQASSN
jgi:hypothetical protein